MYFAVLIRVVLALGTIRMARKSERSHQVKFYQHWYIYIVIFIIGVGGELWAQSLLVPKIEVSGSSMMPGLLPGDLVMTDPLSFCFRDPGRGEVVIMKDPLHRNRLMIKRVAAVAGEDRGRGGFQIRQVPEGYIYVLGDNQNIIADSRVFGPVPVDSIVAKPLRIYWSWDQTRERVRWERIGKIIN